MKIATVFQVLLLCVLLMACKKKDPLVDEPSLPDYSGIMMNHEVEIIVGNRTVKGYLSKPAGTCMDMVIVLHGGTLNYQSSVNATQNQATKPEGGQQFLLNGKAIFSLEYTEFSGPTDTVGVTKGIMEMEEVLASVDFLKTDPFLGNNFTIPKIYAFGHSRGGANALLAGVERELSAVISAEGPLNWEAIRDSIQSGFLMPTPNQLYNFNEGTAAWNADMSLWTKYSPALRLDEFQTPFMVIAGATDTATFQDMAVQMEINYLNCGNCISGSSFVFHPNGHTDWGVPVILDSIQGFVDAY